VRFSVIDANSNHLISQRVLPLTSLRPGYRHIRLRSPQNQPLQLSTLFVYSRIEEESLDSVGCGETPSGSMSSISISEKLRLEKEQTELIESILIPLKRRMFFLMVRFLFFTFDELFCLKKTHTSVGQQKIRREFNKDKKSPFPCAHSCAMAVVPKILHLIQTNSRIAQNRETYFKITQICKPTNKIKIANQYAS